MLTFDLVFERLDELPVTQLFGAVGVYTIWASGATQRPTYLGEGMLLDRISKHVKRWRSDILGAAAIITDVGADRPLGKVGSRLAEAFLLELGETLNRRPTQNAAPGQTTLLYEAVQANNLVRINIRGLHPYMHPADPRARLSERAVCSVEIDREGNLFFTTPWNTRARRPSLRSR